MAGFKDIIGHEQIIEHLQNAIGMDKVSHAYIINGPDKSGKMMLAEAFAMALQCEKHGKEACMECHSCRQALGHNQPDIIYVNHEKPNTISLDDIRTQVNNDIDIKLTKIAVNRLEIDELGLDEIDRKILETMIEKYGGKPVGIDALATTIGEEVDTLEDVYEPYLLQIGFISRTSRGRVPLKAAYDHMGYEYK